MRRIDPLHVHAVTGGIFGAGLLVLGIVWSFPRFFLFLGLLAVAAFVYTRLYAAVEGWMESDAASTATDFDLDEDEEDDEDRRSPRPTAARPKRRRGPPRKIPSRDVDVRSTSSGTKATASPVSPRPGDVASTEPT